MTDEPSFDDEIEVMSSDAPLPWSMVPEWITYSDLKPAQRDFYTVLASCVNHSESHNRVWPAGPELADAMKIKNPDQLKPYREALQSIGAVVITEKRYANKMRRRYVYDVRYHPPEGYTGPRSRQEWLSRRKQRLAAAAAAETADTAAFEAANSRETAGQSRTSKNRGAVVAGTPKNGGAPAVGNGGTGTAENRGAKPDQQKPDQQKPDSALAARSAGDGRRPSTGSSARGTSSGSAAADGAGAPNRKSARSGREVLVTPEVQCVLEGFPDALREALVRKVRSDRPKTVVRAIEEQLAGGGLGRAKMLGNRVARRWVTHGYTKHNAAGTLNSPVGATVAMLQPGPCPEPRCEDGELDDGNPCRSCIEREKDRRADKERERKLRAQAKETESRRRACPYCKEDRGSNGQPCTECLKAIDSWTRDTGRFVQQALDDHRRTGGTDQTVTEFRAHMTAEIEQAAQKTAGGGASPFAQALVARQVASNFAAIEHRAALAARADRPDHPPVVAVPAQATWDGERCPGPDNTGCPHDKPALGTDGLCGRCRIEVVKKESAQVS
ncbi:hypothetical protein [Streptomyces candidus]|uniref:Helix-turn-helix domain-containing protein n=1 Tax=Streptomyces candidus TaxID=67283 RepID=A0A7X0HKX4_9ACTN|nr:hypothetical protein [Streptomyces candidus]MBB6439569.1 hypothetical protein [Streptomyces candidus]GHH54605.1 hypothetical protein GCM10018773_57820 [Streptomyces candidus]